MMRKDNAAGIGTMFRPSEPARAGGEWWLLLALLLGIALMMLE